MYARPDCGERPTNERRRTDDQPSGQGMRPDAQDHPLLRADRADPESSPPQRCGPHRWQSLLSGRGSASVALHPQQSPAGPWFERCLGPACRVGRKRLPRRAQPGYRDTLERHLRTVNERMAHLADLKAGLEELLRLADRGGLAGRCGCTASHESSAANRTGLDGLGTSPVQSRRVRKGAPA